MPIYCFRCPTCGPVELVRPMAQAGEPAACASCGKAMERDYAAQQTRGHAVTGYAAASGGAFAHEMRRAYRKGKDWFTRSPNEGKERQLNPPGFDLDRRTGDVIIPARRGARNEYLRLQGYGDVKVERK